MIRFFFISIWTAFFCCCSAGEVDAQQPVFTKDDTLRGSITAERAWWDLRFYNLEIQVNPDQRYITGTNEIRYKVLQAGDQMQIDLQSPLSLNRAEQDGMPLTIKKIGKNAYWIHLPKKQIPGASETLKVWYSGTPKEAIHAPWDGGFSWSEDAAGRPFIATSCQGLGASVWWPCKDHMYDEPDSQRIAVTVPLPLVDVSNGRLRSVKASGDTAQIYEWFVENPINNYGVNVNIGHYDHFSDVYQGEKGALDLNFYVLPENMAKARKQFQQVKLMLDAFEHWFGPYPFYKDGYKLVEVPYLGMEHQSSVTYGNGYMNGYRGMDLSKTGWGKKWDFIIIHESGHEWFANNITYKDIADMWVHESFTNYSEGLYTEYHFGKAAGAAYIRGCRSLIDNKEPIIGFYGVNKEGSSDMYYKGGNMLHTIRQIVEDDTKWRNILRGLNRDFYHKTVDGAEIEAYIIEKSGKPLKSVFDQYLRHTDIPILEYKITKGQLEYRWANCIPTFDMPLRVCLEKGKYSFIYPTTDWKSVPYKLHKKSELLIDENFYVFSVKI